MNTDTGGLAPVKDVEPESVEIAPFQAGSNWQHQAKRFSDFGIELPTGKVTGKQRRVNGVDLSVPVNVGGVLIDLNFPSGEIPFEDDIVE